MHKTGTKRMEEETSKLLKEHPKINRKMTAEKFRGVLLEDLHIVARSAEVNILVYDNEVLHNGIIGELAERSFPQLNYYLTLILSATSYVTDVNKVSKCFRFSTCDKLFRRSSNLKRSLPKSEDNG